MRAAGATRDLRPRHREHAKPEDGAAAAASALAGSPFVVLGDALLDRDVCGSVERLAPEGPVPVLEESEQYTRPGGAALAALLAASGQAEVVLITALGDDDAGTEVERLLGARGVQVVNLGLHGPTPQKIRLRGGDRTLVRLDRACAVSPVGDLSDEAVATLRSARAILVSDYGRGITGMPAIRDEVSRCATRSPLVWDPHPRGTIPVPGTAVATPNRDALARWPDLASETQDARAQEMIERWNIHSVAVTHGKRGAVLYTKGRAPFTVSARLVFGDVCGAGDCLAKTIAVKLANGSTVTAAVQAGVSVASAFVASGGASAVRIEPPEGRTGTL